MGFNGIYPLVNIQKAMENGHRNSGFSYEKWWIFPWQNVSSPEGSRNRLLMKIDDCLLTEQISDIAIHDIYLSSMLIWWLVDDDR